MLSLEDYRKEVIKRGGDYEHRRPIFYEVIITQVLSKVNEKAPGYF